MKLTLQSPIEDFSEVGPLSLTVRTYNILKREGIHTVADFLAISHQDLDGYRNANAKVIIEIAERQLEIPEVLSRPPGIRQILIDFLVKEGLAEEQRGRGHAAAEDVADMLLERFVIEEPE